MVQQTSIDAFYELDSEDHATQENDVLQILREHPEGICDAAVCELMQAKGWLRMTNALVAARRNGLGDRVREVCRKKWPSDVIGKTVIHWSANA